MSFDKLLAKVKDYAIGLKLDRDAHKGKQAVDLNRGPNWAEEEVVAAEDQGEAGEYGINSVNLKCYFCGK